MDIQENLPKSDPIIIDHPEEYQKFKKVLDSLAPDVLKNLKIEALI